MRWLAVSLAALAACAPAVPSQPEDLDLRQGFVVTTRTTVEIAGVDVVVSWNDTDPTVASATHFTDAEFGAVATILARGIRRATACRVDEDRWTGPLPESFGRRAGQTVYHPITCRLDFIGGAPGDNLPFDLTEGTLFTSIPAKVVEGYCKLDWETRINRRTGKTEYNPCRRPDVYDLTGVVLSEDVAYYLQIAEERKAEEERLAREQAEFDALFEGLGQ
ncbi:MAG: hypothetical protein AAGK98_01265 [Pseudomonadota bacterium]